MRELEAADARLRRPGERALDVTEQLGLGQALGNRRRVERDEGLVPARAVVVNRPRNELLARAGLALDQDRAVHRRDELEGREDMVHRRAAADDAIEAETIVQPGPQLRVLVPETAFADAGVQHLRQLDELKRLDQEVDGAALDRLDRVLDPAEPGDDDGANLGIAGERRFEDVHAVGVGQPQIDDEPVVGKPFETGDGVAAVERLRDGKAFGFERFGDKLTQIGLVFDNEHGGLVVLSHRVGVPQESGQLRFRVWPRLPISCKYDDRNADSSPIIGPVILNMPQLPARFDVLVVDDDERVRELVMSYLSSQGMPVTGANDGAAAISLLQRSNGRYRLVITDLNLPGADGFAVLHAARQANASCYVVIVTGYASLDSAILAVRVGAYDYLTKPFSLGQLDVILTRIADRASLEMENRELVHTATPSAHTAVAAPVSAPLTVAKPPEPVAPVPRTTAPLNGPVLTANSALGSIEYRLSLLEQAVARIEARLGTSTPNDRQ